MENLQLQIQTSNRDGPENPRPSKGLDRLQVEWGGGDGGSTQSGKNFRASLLLKKKLNGDRPKNHLFDA